MSVVFSTTRYFNTLNDTSLDFMDLLDFLNEEDPVRVVYPEEYIGVVTGAKKVEEIMGQDEVARLILNGRHGIHSLRLAEQLCNSPQVKEIHLYLACFSFQHELNHITQTMHQIFRDNDTEDTKWFVHHYPVSGMEHMQELIKSYDKEATMLPTYFVNPNAVVLREEETLPLVTGDSFDLAIVDVARMPDCVYAESGKTHLAGRLNGSVNEGKELVIFCTQGVQSLSQSYQKLQENKVHVVTPSLYAAAPGSEGAPLLPDIFIPHCDRLIFPATQAYVYNRWLYLAKSFQKEVITDQPC